MNQNQDLNQNLNQDFNHNQNLNQKDQEIKQDLNQNLKSRNHLLVNLDKTAQSMILYSERAFNSELISLMIAICSVTLSSDLNFQLNNQNLNQTLIRILEQINRPWITTLNVVPSKIHQCLKFFYEGKVVKLQPYQKE